MHGPFNMQNILNITNITLNYISLHSRHGLLCPSLTITVIMCNQDIVGTGIFIAFITAVGNVGSLYWLQQPKVTFPKCFRFILLPHLC